MLESRVVQYYNQLTFIENEFDTQNYVSSFKHVRYGLFLAYILANMADEGIDFDILSGFDKEDPVLNEFKVARLNVNKKDFFPDTTYLSELSADQRIFYRQTFSSENIENDTFYLLVN